MYNFDIICFNFMSIENGINLQTGGLFVAEATTSNMKEPIEKKSYFKEVINFVRTSPIQQLCSFISLAGIPEPAYTAGERILEGNYKAATASLAVTVLNAILAIPLIALMEDGAVERYNEYRVIKKSLTKHGWDRRIIEPKTHSWCQRNAARVAATDTGYKKEVDKYYKERGIKWYQFIS